MNLFSSARVELIEYNTSLLSHSLLNSGKSSNFLLEQDTLFSA